MNFPQGWIFGALSLLLLCAQGRAATLVYTNDVLGEIEPCGCRSNPQGGMLRKSNLLRKLGTPASLLQVDAGDLLFETRTLAQPLEKQAELQAGFLLKSMDMTGHDAVVPGEKDFALGVAPFEKLIHSSKIKFLAANLKKREGGQFLEPHAIFTKVGEDGKQLKIAVFGLVGESLDWPKTLIATSAIKAAKQELKALKGKADLIIALTHQGLEADKKLAEAVPGIDMIVGGHSQSFLQTPMTIGKTVILQSSFRNQYVGVLPLTLPLKTEGHRLVGLDVGYEDAPGDEPMKALVKEFKSAVALLNSQDDPTLKPVQRTEGTTHLAKFQTWPKCAECHLKQFDFWRKTSHENALIPLVAKEQIRNKDCLRCHTVGLGDPDGFQNVLDLAERKRVVQLKDGEAPPEDTAGPERVPPEEFAQFLDRLHSAQSLKDEVRITRTDPPLPMRRAISSLTHAWAPVQCENCHQPGADHPFAGTFNKKVETTTCLKCHTAERAPEWYTKSGQLDAEKVQAKRKLVTCPAGELADEDH